MGSISYVDKFQPAGREGQAPHPYVTGNEDVSYKLIKSPTTEYNASSIFYKILRDKKGRVIKYYEEPNDGSGDWSQSETYYFDDTGNTILYEYYNAAFMQDECQYMPRGSITKNMIRKYFDKEFKLIGDAALALNEFEPVDEKLCGQNTVITHKISRNYVMLKRTAQNKYSKYKWKKLWN